MASLKSLREILGRRACKAVLGGFRPPTDPYVTWCGKALLGLPGESWPMSGEKPMLPLCQFNLAELPYRPVNLADIALITVFIDQDNLPANADANGSRWMLWAYKSLDGLVSIEPQGDRGRVKPFPIRWELIDRDYPSLDDASSMNEHPARP